MMLRTLLALTAVLVICGCNREPQRGPTKKVRETVPAYGTNEVEYEFYLDSRGRKVAHGNITVFYGKSKNVYFRGKNKDDKRHGEWTEFTRNGKKVGLVWFKDGMVDGTFKAWYPSGQLKVKGQNAEGVQVGEWSYYREDGSLQKTEVWKDGEKISTTRGALPMKATPPTDTKTPAAQSTEVKPKSHQPTEPANNH